jgi:hypothetical protein
LAGHARDLMPGHLRILQSGPQIHFRQDVPMAYAAGLNLDWGLGLQPLWHVPFDKFERAAGLFHQDATEIRRIVIALEMRGSVGR